MRIAFGTVVTGLLACCLVCGQRLKTRKRVPTTTHPAQIGLRSPGCTGDGQVGREFGRPGPMLLPDAADSGLTSPMATFSAHTASPPPPSRTPAGS